MVRRDLVTQKLAELADRVDRVRAHCTATADELRRSRDALDLVSFNMMLAVQACADIASHIIADERWPAAASLGAAFERLHERGVISASTANALARAVGLRNLVAHGDAGVDVALVHAAASRGTADLGEFASEVASWLLRQPSP